MHLSHVWLKIFLDQAKSIVNSRRKLSICHCTQKSMSLFRIEALEAQRVQWLGSTRLAKSASFSACAVIAFSLAGSLCLFGWFGSYTKKVALAGILIPEGGIIEVVNSQPGIVETVAVSEGAPVARGQILFRMRTDRRANDDTLLDLQMTAVGERKASLRLEHELSGAQTKMKIAQLDSRKKTLDRDVVGLEGDVAALSARIAIAERVLSDIKEIGAAGFATRLQVNQAEGEFFELAQRLRSAERALHSAKLTREDLNADINQLLSQKSTSATLIHRQLAALQQEENDIRATAAWTIVSHRDGFVTSLNAIVGQSIYQGATIATITPNVGSGKLVLHAFGSSFSTGHIEVGQTVIIKYDAYPHQTYGVFEGRIQSISSTPIAQKDLPSSVSHMVGSAGLTPTPMYRLLISIPDNLVEAKGRSWELRSGSTAKVLVKVDTRSIWEWLLGPLLSIQR